VSFCLGFFAITAANADDFFPGYAQSFTKIGTERGWSPVTRVHYNAQLGPNGALLIGDPEAVAEKILGLNAALGGISRLSFQMSVAAVPHAKLLRAIELLGRKLLLWCEPRPGPGQGRGPLLEVADPSRGTPSYNDLG
jgi:hypothetical protein